MIPRLLAMAVWLVVSAGDAAAQPPAEAAAAVRTTGDALMPAWGFHPLGARYGGTNPTGR